ncbi:YaiO family outer membrane beta-barrel protein [Galbibacter sp. EGI 63066]|uniref:YaiO family outer membrane beta-barrel protein n=1 Tax=Galbibacter sp. EGI 63066 TaxID=2993559 RepID=UPI0022495059|nr:YaiO family outer membrane beta-barrel protein [Galbibacter sp. EGI 63066]MCX2678412.1 YaiO family outer membrane beta-barrel protein [Galbibacter sp. EGI 63066]
MKKMNFSYIVLLLTIFLLTYNSVQAQKLITDSLLVEVIDQVRLENYTKAIKMAQQGIEHAPDYLDFHLFLGRSYQMTKQIDTARYYLNHVIEKNKNYKASFTYLINLELEAKAYKEASRVINLAIAAHPEDREFALKKALVYQLQKDIGSAIKYLKELEGKYPKDAEIKQQLVLLESKLRSDRIGFGYTLTSIDRDPVGPWHLGSVHYIRERHWGSLIGKLNYANRMSGGESLKNGWQYELESYLFMGKRGYSYANIAFSDAPVFPQWRFGYSYYHNLPKAWEIEIGGRYTKAENVSFATGVAGVGKYIGSSWINLRGYFMELDKKWYPALTLTTRYYFDTRFDYATLIAGYGTTPDDRSVQGLIDQRLSLLSYRFGGGYYRIFNRRYITGVQLMYNNQEYIHDKRQNEVEVFLSLQYKF